MKGRPLRTRPQTVKPIVTGGLLGLGDNATVIAACARIRARLAELPKP